MLVRASHSGLPLLNRLAAVLGGLRGTRSPAAPPEGSRSAFASQLSGAGGGQCAPQGPAAAPWPSKKETDPHPGRDEDALDPLSRHAAHLAAPAILAMAPPPATVAPPGDAPALRAMSSLEELLPQLVRRLSMSGDGRRGAIRVEIGAGALAGSTLLVSSEGGRLRVELSAPEAVDAASWRDRIAARLAARGLVVDEISVKNAQG